LCRVLGRERRRAVEADAGALGVAGGPRHGDVGQLRACRGELPEVRGALVAEHRTLAAGEDGGEPAAISAEIAVTHGVDAPVEAVKAAEADSPGDRRGHQARPDELVVAHHPVLAGGDPSHDLVGLVDLFPHTRNKSTSGPGAPLLPAVVRPARTIRMAGVTLAV
jgi:hypothetical protein